MENSEKTTNEVINFLLNKGNEIDSKIINTISEILRLGYDSDRGKEYVKKLLESIRWTVDDMENFLW